MSREDEKLLSAMRLFEALSGVDEALLAKADEADGKKTGIRIWSGSKARLSVRAAASLAAAASLLVVVGALWTGAPMFDSKKSAESTVLTMEDIAETTTGSLMDGSADMVEEEAIEEIAEDAIEEAITEKSDKMSDKETAQGGSEDGAKQDSFGNQKESINAETRVECSENEEMVVAGEIKDLTGASKPDDRIDLTEAQARAVEGLGAYIPDTLPQDYIWESAKALVNDETGAYEGIFLCWTKGMDSIMITISEESAKNLTLTDITKKETYDVSLYDIPYAETVPQEYELSFREPVFAWEDMSLEVVQSRMKVVSDAGDTDTPRGNFSIFYPEGVLLRFNGDGSAEEIWEMLR